VDRLRCLVIVGVRCAEQSEPEDPVGVPDEPVPLVGRNVRAAASWTMASATGRSRSSSTARMNLSWRSMTAALDGAGSADGAAGGSASRNRRLNDSSAVCADASDAREYSSLWR
jgi:hypothetical protein